MLCPHKKFFGEQEKLGEGGVITVFCPGPGLSLNHVYGLKRPNKLSLQAVSFFVYIFFLMQINYSKI